MASVRDRLRRVLADEDDRSIARRYFVSNGFDGTLTSIGVIVGAVLSGVDSGVTVVTIGLGAAVGLGTSAVWSVWEIERAETRAEIRAWSERCLPTSTIPESSTTAAARVPFTP